MLRQAKYLVKLCKDILKIYTLYEKWNHVSGDKLVASFIWCIVYCKIFRLPHAYNMKCNIHEFYNLLLASAIVKAHFYAQQMLRRYKIV